MKNAASKWFSSEVPFAALNLPDLRLILQTAVSDPEAPHEISMTDFDPVPKK